MNLKFLKCIQWILLLSIVMPSSINAQFLKKAKHFEEGEIRYKLKVMGDAELSDLFRETTLTLYLKDDKAKMDLRIMGGFASMQLLTSHKENVVLMDIPILSEKVSIPMKGEDNIFQQILTAAHTNQAPSELGEVRYFPKDKKRIEKHRCYRAEMPIKGTNEMIVLYVAKHLNADIPIPMLQHFENLAGLPLQIDLNIEGLLFQLTAVDIHEYVLDPAIFEVPEDYKIRSLKELRTEIDHVFSGGEPEGVGL